MLTAQPDGSAIDRPDPSPIWLSSVPHRGMSHRGTDDNQMGGWTQHNQIEVARCGRCAGAQPAV